MQSSYHLYRTACHILRYPKEALEELYCCPSLIWILWENADWDPPDCCSTITIVLSLAVVWWHFRVRTKCFCSIQCWGKVFALVFSLWKECLCNNCYWWFCIVAIKLLKYIVNNHVFHEQMKHIEVGYHFIRGMVMQYMDIYFVFYDNLRLIVTLVISSPKLLLFFLATWAWLTCMHH